MKWSFGGAQVFIWSFGGVEGVHLDVIGAIGGASVLVWSYSSIGGVLERHEEFIGALGSTFKYLNLVSVHLSICACLLLVGVEIE